MGLGGLEPPTSSLSAITRLPLCNRAFLRSRPIVEGEVMRSHVVRFPRSPTWSPKSPAEPSQLSTDSQSTGAVTSRQCWYVVHDRCPRLAPDPEALKGRLVTSSQQVVRSMVPS